MSAVLGFPSDTEFLGRFVETSYPNTYPSPWYHLANDPVFRLDVFSPVKFQPILFPGLGLSLTSSTSGIGPTNIPAVSSTNPTTSATTPGIGGIGYSDGAVLQLPI